MGKSEALQRIVPISKERKEKNPKKKNVEPETPKKLTWYYCKLYNEKGGCTFNHKKKPVVE